MHSNFSAKQVAIISALVLLTACARETIQQRPVDGPRARVRIDNGLPIALYPGSYCYKSNKKGEPKPYTSASAYYFGTKVVDSKSVTLGLPATSATPKLHNEYYVEANRPSIVSVSYSSYVSGYGWSPSMRSSCGPVYVAFMPRENRDYEVIGVMKTLGPLNQKVCTAEINEIVRGSNGDYQLKPILPLPAPPCSATDKKKGWW
jgi:hypothetical protein